ncbi:MAG: TolC family protein [Gemmatimonadota bacterium]|nr:TolC family protein [Gemmatimonadota bacterium]MDE3126525.1 TolC family protein [Gemmatimonadota bacterium]MDE3173032.1 TolC family protein [Gemmatimonadota bacterium]MDE3216261.1 TolC family protein [Gemmatimonadota bacterium]
MRLPLSAALVALAAQVAFAQGGKTPASPDLSLDQAIALARQNNPTYLGTVTGRRSADAAVRSAYGAFLPTLSSSFSAGYQQAGSQVFQGLTFTGSSDAVTSHYSLGVNYSLSMASFIQPRLQKANRDATEANITGQAEVLRANVTSAYLSALGAQANAALQDTLVITAQGQLQLARAKMAVGQGTILDVNSAEVQLGQAQIAALTARNTAAVSVATLYQQIGLPQPDSVHLTTTFQTQPPAFALDSLIGLAEARNPAVEALRAQQRAATMGVRSAQSRYTPTLSLSTGWGGNSYQYTNSDYLVNVAQSNAIRSYGSCLTLDSIRTSAGLAGVGCGSPTLTPAEMDAIRSSNNVFPFRFTRSPLSVNATISLPIFDGFNREQTVQQAIAGKENAEYQLRAQELQTRTNVTQAFLNLQLAYRTIALRQQNADQAREEYQYAQDRYRIGQANYLDVTTAHGTFVQAEVDRLNSIYDFQKAFAALENAVGRPLR